MVIGILHCKATADGKLEVPICSVCMEEFSLGQRAVAMRCQHTFHENCIVTWLLKKKCCPVCREKYEGSLYSQQALDEQEEIIE